MLEPRHIHGGGMNVEITWPQRKMIFLGGNEDWDIWFRPLSDNIRSQQKKSFLRLMHVKSADWDDFAFTKSGKLKGVTISSFHRVMDEPDKTWGEWATHGLNAAETKWVEQYVTLFASWVWENGEDE